MRVKPPEILSPASSSTPLNVLEYELMAERADSLGRAGLKAEAALLRHREAAPDLREDRLYEAADAVFALFIQREICGLRNGRDVIARYQIPGEVLARLGVKRPSPKASSDQ